MPAAKASAKAALKGKNNLRKKKVRTTVHFKRPATLRLARSPKCPTKVSLISSEKLIKPKKSVFGFRTPIGPFLHHQVPLDHRVCHEEDRGQQHARLHRRHLGQQASDPRRGEEDVRGRHPKGDVYSDHYI